MNYEIVVKMNVNQSMYEHHSYEHCKIILYLGNDMQYYEYWNGSISRWKDTGKM